MVKRNNLVPVSSAGPHTAVIVGSPQQIKAEPGLARLLAEERGSVLVDNTAGNGQDMARCKRRINFAYSQSVQGHQPASVARRNARERNRVKQVNNGFATLRSHIPLSIATALSSSAGSRGASKKLSKVETLRMAVEYIRSLQDLLDESGGTAHSQAENYYPNPRPTESSLSPPCSDASSSPPPSSYASEGSYNPPPSLTYHQENYEPMSPEDEELLDVISWWQQSQ